MSSLKDKHRCAAKRRQAKAAKQQRQQERKAAWKEWTTLRRDLVQELEEKLQHAQP